MTDTNRIIGLCIDSSTDLAAIRSYVLRAAFRVADAADHLEHGGNLSVEEAATKQAWALAARALRLAERLDMVHVAEEVANRHGALQELHAKAHAEAMVRDIVDPIKAYFDGLNGLLVCVLVKQCKDPDTDTRILCRDLLREAKDENVRELGECFPDECYTLFVSEFIG